MALVNHFSGFTSLFIMLTFIDWDCGSIKSVCESRIPVTSAKSQMPEIVRSLEEHVCSPASPPDRFFLFFFLFYVKKYALL